MSVVVCGAAEQVRQRRHVAMNDHELASGLDERLPLIVPGVANDPVLDPVQTVADATEIGRHGVEQLIEDRLDKIGGRAEGAAALNDCRANALYGIERLLA